MQIMSEAVVADIVRAVIWSLPGNKEIKVIPRELRSDREKISPTTFGFARSVELKILPMVSFVFDVDIGNMNQKSDGTSIFGN